jgi:cell wall-associated NlpC family hydrolase
MLLLSAPGVQEAHAKALTQEGRPYDMLAIVGIALGRNLRLPQHFICSTLVLWAFEQSGNPLINMTFIPLDHFTPRDILLSGKISELKV